MTNPDVLTQMSPADLVRQLSAVAEQFGTLLAELQLHAGEGGSTPEQAVFHRLLAGEAKADEAIAAGLSVDGARLVVATMPDSQVALRVIGQLRSDRGAVAIWQPHGRLVVLVRGTPRTAGQDRGHRAASWVAATVRREAPAASVGISSSLTRPDQVRAAHTEASDAAALAGQSDGGVVFADEQWAQVTLHRLSVEARRALPIDNPVTRLRDYDASHGTDLAHTLRIWLTANADTTASAAALSLHPNSLRYRIKRVQEIAGIDLEDADARALAHVVLGL